MPELPEVETVRLGLEHSVIGQRIEDVSVTGRRTVRRQSPGEFVGRLVGRRFVTARRRGKYLLVDLDSAEVLVVHLRMSGQLRLVQPAEELAPHTHVRFSLSSASELRFVDPRTFGELFVTGDLDARRVPEVLAPSLGLDPIVDPFSAKDLAGILEGRRAPLKAVLLDQRKICGVGNLYADEICFAAKVSPLREAGSLRPVEVRRLATCIGEVLNAAVVARGSSLRDARYRDLSGLLGSYQEHHAVYDRAGLPCLRCAGEVRRSKVSGRSTHYCVGCQR